MKFDIVIVGGGPAGLSAAESASKNGLKVAVLERSKEIGYPVHTSGGSWIKELKELDIPDKFMHPITKGDFVFGKVKSSFHYKKPLSCVLDIRGLYQYLAERASLNGAEIFVDTNVLEPIIENDFVKGVKATFHGKMQIIKSDIVIDASGFSSIITKKVGLLEKFDNFAMGAEYELIAPSWDQSKATLIYGSRVAPAGYGWVFPCGENRVRIGTGIIYPNSDQNPTKLLDDFLQSDDDIVQELGKFSRLEFHRGVVPNVGVVEKSVANGLIAVGDSVCHVSGLAGEGIRFAIDIGRMSGKIAGKSISAKDYSEKFLKKYDKMWRKKYEKIFKISNVLNKRFRSYTDDQWKEKVKNIGEVNPEIIAGFMKSDFNLKFIYQILKLQPSLLTSKAPISSFRVISKYFKKKI